MLTFSAETHTYYWNDKPIPSVTQVIREWMPVSVYGVDYFVNSFTGAVLTQESFRAAADFGKAVHQMVGLRIAGALDVAALHTSLLPVLTQFDSWAKLVSPEFIGSELPLYHKRYSYAGTLDILCKIKHNMAIIDIKTGGYDMAGVQIEAYKQAYKEENGIRIMHIDRYVLFLPKDGGQYKFIKLDNPAGDWTFFLSRLNERRYLDGINR